MHVLVKTLPLLLALQACGSSATPDGTTPDPLTATEREQEAPMRPPIAKTVPHPLTHHGHVREDPYYWLRDDNREDPEILAYLNEENAYTDAMLEPLSGFRENLYQEIVARIPQEDRSVPYRKDGFWYYRRDEEGKEYGIHCRRADGDNWQTESEEQVILDGNLEAQGHEYWALGGMSVSVDGKTMAYGEDTLSRRIYTLRFRNLETGDNHEEAIEGTTGRAVWALDHRTVFYVRREEGTLRAYQVWRHVLGTEPSEDVLIYEEEDDEFYVGIRRSRSRDYILIGSYQTLSHEYRTIDARRPTSEPVVFLPREREHEYDIDHANGRFYVRTNWEARDFRLMSVTPRRTADKDRWQEEIPARDGILFRGFELFERHLVVSERREGILRLRVIPWRNRDREHEVAFEDAAYYADLSTNSEFDTNTLRFGFTSMSTPNSIYDYDMETRERTLLKQQEVVGDFDSAEYVTARITVRARDGIEVPVSIVHRRDLDRSQPQPLLLYGYGSYGYSLDPTFSSPRLSLLDRGVIYAIAHIRGGQEMGRAWYENGKLLQKRNTFTDFIDCAAHLVEEGWTASDKLFAHGGSAGGLLMGAVANMRPDLFNAVVADVPFVDVVTTMLDESIPLTTFEYDEWGNPNQEEFYRYMLTYSPYDNVTAQDYPNMLVLTGLHDSQVQYWEPAKWVARLRATKTDDNRLLFAVNMDAGHGGASGRFRRHRETALIYAFLLDLVGVRE
ncbi:MAG: S9 family peptidase [Myxococcota bacterium]